MTISNDTLFTADTFKNNCDEVAQLSVTLLSLIDLGSDPSAIRLVAQDLYLRSDTVNSQACFVSPIPLCDMPGFKPVTQSGH